ncbi:30S ribosomal protein S5 [Candidatus Nesciobacter abundans]|uniref:Small ribosomal subunit protein uS5 n=1 Tax=Candidatus Nesciobacter abundans TaxID=2601668 RepID=A0A5C0UFT6_9PROT|nr:30S ribosomal protein S5 [Candidatus Nesciobacter abundans]QEK38918.1 30S ribosomal protein S5 [Candidatus Nesciobacter abundans]
MTKQYHSSTSKLKKNVLSLNWVSATTKGGKRQRICAFVVVGDGAGSVGYALGKAKEVPEAVKKAIDKATANMFKVHLRDNKTFHHDINTKYCGTKICIRSAKSGSGIIANETVRSALNALGVKSATVKVIGSSNPYNVIRALFKGLEIIQPPKLIAARRGISVKQVIGI